MKKHYQVKIREHYGKFVDIYVEDESQIEDIIAEMEENGEIDWDRANDFEGWEIKSTEEVAYADWEIRSIKKWCMEMVKVTDIVDPDWVEEEMTEYECMDWLEQIRSRGVVVPSEVTSSDLWDAVEAYRRKDMSYAKSRGKGDGRRRSQ